jgi:hypothetical protein
MGSNMAHQLSLRRPVHSHARRCKASQSVAVMLAGTPPAPGRGTRYKARSGPPLPIETVCDALRRIAALSHALSGFRVSPPGCHPAATPKRLSGVRIFEQRRSNARPPCHKAGAPTRHSDHYFFALHTIRPAEAAWQFRWPKHEMQHPPSVVDQSLRRSVE